MEDQLLKEDSLAQARKLVLALNALYPLLVTKGGSLYRHLYDPVSSVESQANDLLLIAGQAVMDLAKHYGLPSDEEFREAEVAATLLWDELMLLESAHFEKEEAWIRRELLEASKTPKPRKECKEEMIATLSSVLEKMLNAHRDVEGEVHDRWKIVEAKNASLGMRQGQAYRKALEAVGVEFAVPADFADVFRLGNKSARKTLATVRDAVKHYPRSFMESSTALDQQVTIRQSGRRQFLSVEIEEGVADFSIFVDKAQPDAATHELGHLMELVNPFIGNAERVFLRYMLSDGTFASREKGGVVSYRLLCDYSAKVYPADEELETLVLKGSGEVVGVTYEVFTTGMEAVFFGNYGGGHGSDLLGSAALKECRVSDSHMSFVLGLLCLGQVKSVS